MVFHSESCSAGDASRSRIESRPPDSAHRGTSTETRLVPDASYGYWSANTSTPSSRTLSIRATSDDDMPHTCGPNALMCVTIPGRRAQPDRVVRLVADVARVDAAVLRRDLRQLDQLLGVRVAPRRVERPARH